jgi:competence protein ComEC
MAFSLPPGDIAFGAPFAFLAGVFVASLYWDLPVVFCVAALCAGAAIVHDRRFWKECLLFLFALACGVFYFHFYHNVQASETHLPSGKKTTLSVLISDEPQPSEKFLMLAARALPPFAGDITIFAPLGGDFAYGDLLSVSGALQPPDAGAGNPTMFSPKIRTLARHRGFLPREWMIDLKLAILNEFQEALPPDEAALLGGIAFGSKVSFKKELKSAMALSGTTHLVAVSGYNITIVILAVGGVFGRFFSRRTTFFIAIIFLVLFMLMVGGAASGVRAAIMGFLALVAREAGRMFSMRNAVTITAMIMALFDPTVLTKNMSFILSFASLLGIVYIGPPLKLLLRYNEEGLLDWKENAVTTLSAQLAVLPVLINTFGQFSATAVIANVLVLGTVPLTMFFGVLLAVLGFISSYLAFFAGKLIGLLLHYQLSVIRFFAMLAVPLPLPLNSAFAMAFYYAILVTFVASYGNKNHGNSKEI